MKQKLHKLLLLSVTSLILASCGQNPSPTSSSEDTSTTTSETTSETSTTSQEEVVLKITAPVTKRQSFIDYASNIKEKFEKREEFMDRTQGYFVGDDNAVNFKPQFHVFDQNLNEHDQDEWDYDYEFSFAVKNDKGDFVPANSDDFKVENARTCDVKFGVNAVGKTFRVTVMPGGLTNEQKDNDNFKVTYEVQVIDGYNAYTAKELGYLDDRHGDIADNDWHPGNVGGLKHVWDAFKTANGMSTELDPSAVILHQNITITAKDIPSEYIYSEADGVDPKYYGTYKDTAHVYGHISNTELTLNGNYFKLDYSQLPLNVRNEDTETDKPLSHTALVRTRNGIFNVKNINITGNAPLAQTNEDNKYAGGLIFNKAGYDAVKTTAYNVISRSNFINYFAEYCSNEFVFDVDKCKSYDNYNSFFYNSGSMIFARNSEFAKCGGPIVIQDHTEIPQEGAETVTQFQFAEDTTVPCYTPNGNVGKCVFEDCSLVNYITGEEAWFIEFGANLLAPQIKAMSDLFVPFGKSFTYDVNGNPTIVNPKAFPPDTGIPSLFPVPEKTFLNFVAFNKSGSVAGISNVPTCGEVIIKNSETVDKFNYSQPDNINFNEAKYIAENLAKAQEGDAEAQQIVAELMAKYQISDPAYFQLIILGLLADGEPSYVEQVTNHALIRGLNSASAPVFETAGGYAYFDGVPANGLQRMTQSAVQNTQKGGTDYEKVEASDSFIQKANDHVTIYYMGMAIVLGMSNLSLPQ